MLELVTVLGAFCLYLIILPLVGLIGAVVCRIFLPYLLGVGLIYALLVTFLSDLSGGLLLLLAVAIWCVPSLCVRYWPRQATTEMAWHQGHFRAVFALLTCGLFSMGQQVTAEDYPFGDIAQKDRQESGVAEF